jgi:aminoglycoside phosphotransferase (APT) family kinase protein
MGFTPALRVQLAPTRRIWNLFVIDPKQHPTPEWIAALRRRFPTHSAIDDTLTLKLQRRTGPPHRPQPIATVVERLTAFLSRRIDGAFTISDVRPLAGGSSKEQFAFTLNQASGASHRYVLRMRPAAGIVEAPTLREFQSMNAVQGLMPAPRALWVDPFGEEMGQDSLITDFCSGVTAPPYKGPYNPRIGLGAKYRALLAPQFTRHFADLARFDWRGADMSSFDQPREGSNEGVMASINWWERVWEEDAVEAYPLMTLAARWLRENAPPIDHVSLVHTDFRKGNFLFDADTGRITAILDWELAHLGDRHEDVAYFLSPIFTGFDENNQLLAGGMMPREQFLEQYEALSGLPLDAKKLDYYALFNAWRGAINMVATATRCMIGQKTHQDIRLGWIGCTSTISLTWLHEELQKRIG